MRFAVQTSKAQTNVRKHGVSFEEAATAFADPLARIFDDPDDSSGEARFLLIGESRARRELIVVHVERSTRIRIISARRATNHERERIGGVT
jgi:hypothetical protein